MRRPVVFLAGLLASFALTVSQSQAALTYTYMATLQDVNNNALNAGDNVASYAQGGSVTMAIYLVETYTGTSKSLIAQQNGLFTGAFKVERQLGGSAGDAGATVSNNNIEWTQPLAPGGDQTNVINRFAEGNNGGAPGGGNETGPFNGTNNITGGVPAGQTGTESVGLASGVASGAGTGASYLKRNGGYNGTNGNFVNNASAIWVQDDQAINSTNNGNNGSGYTDNGVQNAGATGQVTPVLTALGNATNGRYVQFLGTVTFSGGSVGTTTFKVKSGGAADPLTQGGNATGSTGRFSLATNGVAGVTAGTGSGGTLLPAGYDYTGTNAFAGFDITITVTPEPSSMLLGTFAVAGMGYGAYRRRRAAKAAVAG